MIVVILFIQLQPYRVGENPVFAKYAKLGYF